MKRYVFISERMIPERLLKDPVVLELVRSMRPEDVVTALTDAGLHPSDASLAAGALLRHANASMDMPYRDTKEKKSGKKKHLKGQLEGVLSPETDVIDFMFPEEDEEPEDWPYDAQTLGVMGTPLAPYPRTN